MARQLPQPDLNANLKTDPAINYYFTSKEKLQQCPYEKSHKILENKFILHLTRCRKNYILNQKRANKEVDIVVCRFSSFHHVKKVELEAHEETCPTRLEEELEAARINKQKGNTIFGTKVKKEDLDEFDREKEEQLQRIKQEVEETRERDRIAEMKFEEEHARNNNMDRKPLSMNSIVGSVPSVFKGKGDIKPFPNAGAAGGVKIKEEDDEDWESIPPVSWEEQSKDRLWGAALPGTKDFTAKYEAAARQNVILNPQGLTKSERKEYRQLVSRIKKEKEEIVEPEEDKKPVGLVWKSATPSDSFFAAEPEPLEPQLPQEQSGFSRDYKFKEETSSEYSYASSECYSTTTATDTDAMSVSSFSSKGTITTTGGEYSDFDLNSVCSDTLSYPSTVEAEDGSWTEVRPQGRPRRGRSHATPVGYPGWDVEDGDRRTGKDIRGGYY